MEGITVGQHLRKKREEKNIPLGFVSGITRLSLMQVQALESDDFHIFPAEIFIHGFLRNDARSIQLDPEEIIGMYLDQAEAKRSKSEEISSPPPPSHSFFMPVSNFLSAIANQRSHSSAGKIFISLMR